MKKYLLTSAAALAFSGLFTSCTHDFDNDGGSAAQNSVMKTYEQAFITAFGQPDPNQEWGFGVTTQASTRALTRGYTPSYDYYHFPGDADDNKFLSELPDNNIQKGANFSDGVGYVDNTVKQVNVWNGSADSKVYIVGYCDFTQDGASFYVGPNSEVYLLEGSTLKLTSGQAGNLQGNCKYYIASSAKLETSGDLPLNNGMKIYNHGTIEAASISPNNNSVLYNKGYISVSGRISVENTLSVIVNDGLMEGASLNTAGSGKFENNGTMNISGQTLVNSNYNTWVNNGTYNTGSFDYHAASTEVINNCRLNVTNRFTIKLADSESEYGFKLNGGAGVDTREFSAEGPGRIYMGSNSVFKVRETAYMGITKDLYGIYGPENGAYAVFQANSIVRGNYVDQSGNLHNVDPNQGFVANYFQKVYVVTGSHFNFGYSDKSAEQQANGEVGNQPYYKLADGAVLYTGGEKAPIKISSGVCNPGYEGDDPGPDPDVIRVICEDLSVTQASDWDFNDVVFDVELINNNTQAQITLRAAGGTLPLWVGTEEHEVHEEFAKTNEDYAITTSSMVTTTTKGDGNKYTFKGLQPATFTVDIQPKWTEGASSEGDGLVKAVAKNMPVKVYKMVNGGTKTWVELNCERGKATAKVAVKNDYQWCDERDHINQIYKYEDMRGNEYGGFTMFSRGILDANDWYKYKGPVTDEMGQEYTGQ